MDNIRQEGPNLNIHKRVIWQSLNKKFGTHIEKSMVFKTFKNKQCIALRSKFISGKSPCGVLNI